MPEGVLQREGRPFPRSISIGLSVLFLISVQPITAPPVGTQTPLSLGSGEPWATLHPQPPLRHGLGEAGGSAHGGELVPLVLRANLHRARRRARECPSPPSPRLFHSLTAPQLLPPDVAGGGRGQGRSLELSLRGPVACRAPSRQAALQGLLGSLSRPSPAAAQQGRAGSRAASGARSFSR